MQPRSYLHTTSRFFRDVFLVLGITVFLIFIGHYLIGAARFVKHSIKGINTGITLQEELRKEPIFSSYQDYDKYFEEAGKSATLQVLPYYHWRREPYFGDVIQVDNEGKRRTIKNPAPNAKKVFMFGGSTMWGTGTPDRYTIPSQLQALLGSEYDVYNFGETAFVSVQELNLLLEQLSKGFIPDVVIFYDGVNDTYASLYSPGKVRHPQFVPEDYTSKTSTAYLITKLLEKTNYIAITERLKMWLKKDALSQWETNVEKNLDQQAKETMKQYRHLMRQASALGREYGFKVYYFWQPLLLTQNRVLTEYEKKIYEVQSPALIKTYHMLYKVAGEMHGKDNFYYIADIFDNVNEPIFFDFCHVGPKGNAIVAENIYKMAFNG